MKAKHFCEAGAIRAATNTTCGVKKKLRDLYQPLHWWVNKSVIYHRRGICLVPYA